MRRWLFVALLATLGCSDGPTTNTGDDMAAAVCTPDAITACEEQCKPGVAGGVCYPDPICGRDGKWECFCRPCAQDMSRVD